ncbi:MULTISPECIES: hypothetical protein [Aeromonas]|uniref:hypothetical protein n=1 Tax=Aeromonas TaxID=642 RepID=UPI001495CD8E|nr:MULTISPECIES: hypothetical protein [Aeromonas]MBA8783934.1 hypothetical protein [Aeromonas caviae]MBA8787931.1 hypothetical protein [Aeromonas sp. TW 6]BBS87774.1 hypothetical protein WP7W18E02_26710 [Aeromonas media]
MRDSNVVGSGDLIIIRTHFFNQVVEDLLDRIIKETDKQVCLVVDETLREVPVPSRYNKVGYNKNTLNKLGLAIPNQVGWRCGDYNFYIAAEYFKDFENYWVIEPDIYFNYENLSDFFECFDGLSFDMLAPEFSKRPSDWFWAKHIIKFIPEVYGCIFPIVRLSKRAVNYLYHERKKISTILSNSDVSNDCPNDEGFVASCLMQGGFSCSNINKIERVYSFPETFNIFIPISRKALIQKPVDNLIYHSVLEGQDFGRKAQRVLYNRNIEISPDKIDKLLSDALIELNNSDFQCLQHLANYSLAARKENSDLGMRLVLPQKLQPGLSYIDEPRKQGYYYSLISNDNHWSRLINQKTLRIHALAAGDNATSVVWNDVNIPVMAAFFFSITAAITDTVPLKVIISIYDSNQSVLHEISSVIDGESSRCFDYFTPGIIGNGISIRLLVEPLYSLTPDKKAVVDIKQIEVIGIDG